MAKHKIGKTTGLFLKFRDEGDSTAFDELLLRLRPSMRRTVARLGLDAATIEDVLQSSCVVLLEKPERYRMGHRFRSWVSGIVSREARATSRGLRRRPDPDRLEISTPTEPDEVAVERELTRVIYLTIDRLTPRSREVVWLHLLGGLGPNEIACKIGCGASTVRSRLARGLATVRQQLTEVS